MIQTESRIETRSATTTSLSLLDLSVKRSDWMLILKGLLLTLVVALPVGYATGFLTRPHVPDVVLIAFVVDIAQIVLFEEILFRAFLFRWLQSRIGLQPAAIVSSIIFGLLHLIKFDYPMAIMAGWAGYVLAHTLHRTGRISTPMLLHAALIVIEFFLLPVA